MNRLDSIARVGAKDCMIGKNTIVFLVPEKDMRQAIGKNGDTIKRITEKLGKKVELFEYTEQPEKFFEKAFFKAKLTKVEIKKVGERTIAFVGADAENKKIVLGNLGRLKKVKELAKRNYNIDEVRVR